MRCQVVALEGSMALVCGSARREKTCHACGAAAEWLCDFRPQGKARCSRPLCSRHRKAGAAGDLCASHFTWLETHGGAGPGPTLFDEAEPAP